MKQIVQDDKGNLYTVILDKYGYIESYSKLDNSNIPNREPDIKDAYYQIDESLPSRFDAWNVI